jgi:3-methyladenine DNA glycosylase AlkC
MPEALKNSLYNRETIEALANAFASVDSVFQSDKFLASVYDDQWDNLELKERMHHITSILHDMLPDDYCLALDIIRRAAPALSGYGWITLSFCDFVEQYGLNNWDESIPALEQFTQLCSAEFAVRPFIVKDQDRMMGQMRQWATHEQPSVRRLASEGCRPLLPWAINLPALKTDPSPILPILEMLKSDESESVRRSVANNLNDISKDNPQAVIDLLNQWKAHDTNEMHWLINHALRTLVKAGNQGALELLGFGKAAVAVNDFVIEPNPVQMGSELTFSFTLESQCNEPQTLMVDYILHLVRTNGKYSEKVFKLAKRSLQPGETTQITRNFSFKPISTRKYYPGEHAIEIQINGQRLAKEHFVLVE